MVTITYLTVILFRWIGCFRVLHAMCSIRSLRLPILLQTSPTYLGSNDSFDFYVTFHDLFNHSLLVIFRMTILHTKTLLWCWGSLIHSDFWVQRSASFWGLTVSRLTFSQTSIQALKKEIQGYAKFKCKLEIIRL